MKLKELNAQCNTTIENFDNSKELSPSASMRGNLAGLKELKSKIVELQVIMETFNIFMFGVLGFIYE